MRSSARPPGRIPLALTAVLGALDRVLRDPSAVGAALVTGRLPGPLGTLLQTSLRVAGRAGSPGARVLLAHGAGDADAVDAEAVRARSGSARSRRQVARALLAVGRSPEAADLVGRDRTRAGSAVRARALWATGRLDEAVAATPSHAVARRWRSEVDVLSRRPRRPAPGSPRPATARTSTARTGSSPGGPRVLHLVTNSLPHTRSGYTGRSHQILTAQAAAGMTVAAVTPFGYPGTVLRLPAGPVETVDGVDYHRLLPRRWHASAVVRHAEELTQLDRLVTALRPDVLHAHSHFVNALTALEVGARHGLPVVYEVRGLLEETWAQRSGPDARRSQRYRLYQEQEAFAVGEVDAALTIGAAMRDVLTGRARPRRPIGLVPNAVPAHALQVRGDREATRARLGIPAGSLVVGSVSSVVDYEGFDVLARAVATLAATGVDVTMLLVGDGDAAPAVRAAATAVRPPGRVVMPGRVPAEAVADHLAALDVFVVPRLDLEVCRLVTPLKPAEAMAAGLPLVVSDLPALREFVADGEGGLVVPPGDPAALAAALGRLVDPGLRRRLGAEGRERVAATRTWEAVVETYAEVYDAVRGDGS